jgi:hypothetical protein
MKWFVVAFMLLNGHLEQRIDSQHGPWASKAQCESWLTAWENRPELGPSLRGAPNWDAPEMQAAMKQMGMEHFRVACALVGDQ